MKGFVKCIIAGAVILGIGLAVFIIALAVNGWSFAPDFETKEFTSEQEVTSLNVSLSAGKLKIEYHDGDDVQITYPSSKGYNTEITENDGTLTIDGNKHKWYVFSWGVEIPETVVKVPQNTITEISVTVNAGTVDIPDGSFESVKVKVNAGVCNVGTITECQLLDVNVNAGALNVKGVTATELTCEVNAGSAKIAGINCGTSTFKVNAGSANLTFAGAKTDYNATVNVSAGSCNGIDTQSGNTDKSITVKVNAGSLNASFGN